MHDLVLSSSLHREGWGHVMWSVLVSEKEKEMQWPESVWLSSCLYFLCFSRWISVVSILSLLPTCFLQCHIDFLWKTQLFGWQFSLLSCRLIEHNKVEREQTYHWGNKTVYLCDRVAILTHFSFGLALWWLCELASFGDSKLMP